MRAAPSSHAVFAATMFGIGIMGLLKGDFAPIWQPVPAGVPERETLAYVCALVSLGPGLGILWKRAAAPLAGVLLVFLLLWLLLLRVPGIFFAPAVEGSWSGWGETAVYVAGAWVLYASVAPASHAGRVRLAGGAPALRMARVLYGLALVPFGIAHFIYLKETAALVPSWLPGHVAWAYFTGAAFIAAGIAVLIGVCARLAAALSTVQMGLFTLLVWFPIVARGTHDAGQWSETVISCALTASGWVLADSYRGMRWLALNQR